MSTYTPTQLQSKLFAITGAIFIPAVGNMSLSDCCKLISDLAHAGYRVTNPEVLMCIPINVVNAQLPSILSSQTLDAFKFRQGFAASLELEDYNTTDWANVYNQYATVYGWNLLPNVPVKPTPQLIPAVQVSNLKDITFMSVVELQNYFKSILESKIPLRPEQIELIRAGATFVAGPTYKFSIRATEAIVQQILYEAGFFYIPSSVDLLLRFALTNGLEDKSSKFDNQILPSQLSQERLHIPTRLKKLILGSLDRLVLKKSVRVIAEEIFAYETFWKRLLHHCHWTSKARQQARYPHLYELFEVLYSSDRSWTFNSRYQAALDHNDYELAINTLSEKPGLVLRNLVMFCKYIKGVPVPSKSSTITAYVATDARQWLETQFEQFLSQLQPSIKVAIQTAEELLSPTHLKPINNRYVQGTLIHYATPIPAIDVQLRDFVVSRLFTYVSTIKQAQNKSLGSIFIDPALSHIAIEYSGAKISSDTCAGTYLTSGSSIIIPDDVEIVRMGVAWKDTGRGSCDIDLNSSFISETNTSHCSFHNPTFNVSNKLIAASSGDITYCHRDVYSAEFIDIDMSTLSDTNYKYVVNTLNMFSGRTFDMYDTHVFITFLKRKDRPISQTTSANIDLAKQDYAIRINTGSKNFIGSLIDVQKRLCRALNIDTNEGRITIGGSFNEFVALLNRQPKRINLSDLFDLTVDSSQLVTDITNADISIGVGSQYTIDVTTNMEKALDIIF